MKKQLTAVLLIFALLLTLSGCSVVSAAQKLETAENALEAKLDAAEDKLENRFSDKVPSAPAAAPTIPAAAPAQTQPEPTQTLPAVTESGKTLTKEQAQQIALDYLGFTADQVTRMHTEYEVDDGIPQFDIEFHQGDWEYEFEIHAEKGQIISYDKDHKYD